MSVVSKFLLLISTLQLLHSGFSSHEFLTMKKRLTTNSNLNVDAVLLPKDIQLEAICGVVLLTLSIFLSFGKQEFLPLSGKMKLLKEDNLLQEINMNKATNSKNLAGCNPYGDITHLPSFVDIHEKREEVRRWRDQETKQKD
ncbi:LANO_0F10594g1_1 [Lachancea nothofagi CBS 11611]|uniref:LANO_0F10594g1_1 n=1 Tax=Lachancea nothofagi CBS 11611 TaxID=1266666 RepID=A0A1G4KAI2_9SACH|nr:LANO_0F10594g1_1 [Lachancea nothofagi CBS 11611]